MYACVDNNVTRRALWARTRSWSPHRSRAPACPDAQHSRTLPFSGRFHCNEGHFCATGCFPPVLPDRVSGRELGCKALASAPATGVSESLVASAFQAAHDFHDARAALPDLRVFRAKKCHNVGGNCQQLRSLVISVHWLFHYRLLMDVNGAIPKAAPKNVKRVRPLMTAVRSGFTWKRLRLNDATAELDEDAGQKKHPPPAPH
jgi:hypothetical protein